MGLDDREWMRRESSERQQEGRARKRHKAFRWNALHVFGGMILLTVLALTWPSLCFLVDRLSASAPVEGSVPIAEGPQGLPASPPEIAHRPTAPVASSRRSLRDCLNGGNAIDEDVIRCQNGGELPHARAPQNAFEPQGMASQEYLAQFQAERNQRMARQGSAQNYTQERDSQWIKSWDGGSNYLVEWVVVNNVIDGGTVCRSLGWGSIQYREGRKGAKLHFRGSAVHGPLVLVKNTQIGPMGCNSVVVPPEVTLILWVSDDGV
ncbi:hypothetical protein OLM89_29655 [Pseudomonas aeruginosa]|uniref:hypothetical protein n=1 Tax=Pseudomonas aeruginosa TaxID=287 RepID=UPI002499403F|nr:hypothetical protein [Pseudomonas aeruginosa]MBX5583296.1 hypothetical protein [Pseudomonas aeruginosa]MBX5627708.1 hypothetical protein [Pseudomonas aeruginosa]MBX5633586.1 hypothetical protein [Pseudomonas aeruginosa]MBX5676422.1 hypothetical protein [Pseudomonas aeruginosa]MDI2355175.1 hypothetical protein [Pseudomonas aeruginosa]